MDSEEAKMDSETSTMDDPFEDLWKQLRECHNDSLRELETKVSKLKKERCLDAKRLEVFYTRNQQLKEQNKKLQDALCLLEERLCAGESDCCAVLGENLKNDQEQKLRLISQLKKERNSLEEENGKLRAELQKLKFSRWELQQASSPEQEDGAIPDSPVLTSSLPVLNKLRKHRKKDDMKHVRYAEMFVQRSNNSLFRELTKEPTIKNRGGGAEVLVPNTCELDPPEMSDDVNLNLEVIAETCRLEPLDQKSEMAAGKRSSRSALKYSHLMPHRPSSLSTLIHSPDPTTETSLSHIPRVQCFTENGSINKAKRRKKDCEPEVKEVDKQERNEEKKQAELIEQTFTSTSTSNKQSLKKNPPDKKDQLAQNGTFSQKPNVSCLSPVFKKPNVGAESNGADIGGRGGKPALNTSHHHHSENVERKHQAETAWSVDPALALSMYDSEWRRNEEDQQCCGDLADTDCTWVSHSVLHAQMGNSPDRSDHVSGLGEKANDSLDMMFDTTATGEYKSYNSPHLGQSQPPEEEDEDDDEDQPEQNLSQEKGHKMPHQPTFAHVAVVRKKDERKKLKGTTCKECEIYYAHLPHEEKQKKLTECSRHRFRYIPPSTPENFWEVGFPSTQTCIERGYIKEEKNPKVHPRRRQPFNALFSPNRNQQEQ